MPRLPHHPDAERAEATEPAHHVPEVKGQTRLTASGMSVNPLKFNPLHTE